MSELSNKALIASAPELLQALKETVDALADNSAPCEYLHHDIKDEHELHMECPVEKRLIQLEVRVRRLIARAEGRA